MIFSNQPQPKSEKMKQYLLQKMQAWLKVDEAEMTLFQKLSATFWILLSYSPFIFLSCIGILITIEERGISAVNAIPFTALLVVLFLCGAFAQAMLDYNVFPRFEKFAKIVTLPVYLILKCISIPISILVVSIIGVFEVIIIPLVGGLLALSLSLFFILGVVGVLWFGIKQLIY